MATSHQPSDAELASEEEPIVAQAAAAHQDGSDSDHDEEDEYADEEDEEGAFREALDDDVAFAATAERSLAAAFNYEMAHEESLELAEGDAEDEATIAALPTFAQLAREVMPGTVGFGEGSDEERLNKLFVNLKLGFKDAQHLGERAAEV